MQVRGCEAIQAFKVAKRRQVLSCQLRYLLSSRRDYWDRVCYVPGIASIASHADLDGKVDHLDWDIWNKNLFLNQSNWIDGDFNLDGGVDGTDFNIWNENRKVESPLNAIIALAASGPQSPLSQAEQTMDINGDGLIKLGGAYGTDANSDVKAYLDSIGRSLGDAVLDGLVNAHDFDMVMAHANQSGTNWSTGDFNGDTITNIYDYLIWYNNRTDPSLNGDLSFNGSYGVDDIDEMFEALAIVSANSSDPYYQSLLVSMYDLNGDNTINQLDVDYLVETLLGTAYGDANYDGIVNAADLNIVVLHLYTNVSSWAEGDFNGDGVVDDDDMDLLLLNWGFGL